MEINIDASGLNKVKGNFEERARKIKSAIRNILKSSVLTVQRFGKMYSPVKTGRMRASIIPTEITQSTASVAPQVFYAPFVHRRIPFMFAARQDSIPEVEQIAEREIKRAIQ